MQVCFSCFSKHKSAHRDVHEKAFSFFTKKLVEKYEKGELNLTFKNIYNLRHYQLTADYKGDKLEEMFRHRFVTNENVDLLSIKADNIIDLVD